MSRDVSNSGAAGGDLNAPRVYYPTPYTSTIEAFQPVLAAVNAAIESTTNSAVATDLIIL